MHHDPGALSRLKLKALRTELMDDLISVGLP
jgi:hypothetical protein